MATSEASQRAITAQNPSRDQQRGPTRRAAVAQLLAGWSLFSLAAGVGLLGCVRFLFPNVLYEPPATFNAGMPSNYGVGVDETFKNTNSTWLVRTESDPLSGRDGIPGIFAFEYGLHASRLHPELAGCGQQVQVPVSRERLPPQRHEL